MTRAPAVTQTQFTGKLISTGRLPHRATMLLTIEEPDSSAHIWVMPVETFDECAKTLDPQRGDHYAAFRGYLIRVQENIERYITSFKGVSLRNSQESHNG